MNRQKLMIVLSMSTVYIVWGSTFYGLKVGLEGGLPPLSLVGVRFLLAGAVLYGLTSLSRRRRVVDSPQAGRSTVPGATWLEWKEAGLLGFLLLVCGPGLVGWSQQWVSSSMAALLVATSPVWVTLLDRDQKLDGRKWVGLILGLVGVGALVGASFDMDRPGFLWGCAGCLLSAMAWAVGSLRARRARPETPKSLKAGMQMMAAGVMLLLGAWIKGETFVVSNVRFEAWLALAYLTLLGSVVAFSAYVWLVGNVSASVVSTHAYVNPVIAVLLGSLFGGETLTAGTGLAAAIALTGVVVLMLPTSQGGRDISISSPAQRTRARRSGKSSRRKYRQAC